MGNSLKPQSQAPQAESRARALARLLDSAFTIPGTGIKVGLDALVGLVPGGGDIVGAALASGIVLIAMREGVPAAVLWRMVGNIAIDTLIGAVPVLGDLFDFAWKANTRNADLLEQYQASPHKTKTRSLMVGLLVLGTLVLLVGAILATTIFLLRGLLGFT